MTFCATKTTFTFTYDYFNEFSAAKRISLIEAHFQLISVKIENYVRAICDAELRPNEAAVRSMEVTLNSSFSYF